MKDTGKRGSELWGRAEDAGRFELSGSLEEAVGDTVWSVVYLVGVGSNRSMFGFGVETGELKEDEQGVVTEALQNIVDNMLTVGSIVGDYEVVLRKVENHG